MKRKACSKSEEVKRTEKRMAGRKNRKIQIWDEREGGAMKRDRGEKQIRKDSAEIELDP